MTKDTIKWTCCITELYTIPKVTPHTGEAEVPVITVLNIFPRSAVYWKICVGPFKCDGIPNKHSSQPSLNFEVLRRAVFQAWHYVHSRWLASRWLFTDRREMVATLHLYGPHTRSGRVKCWWSPTLTLTLRLGSSIVYNSTYAAFNIRMFWRM
jgi:hypothetical protein